MWQIYHTGEATAAANMPSGSPMKIIHFYKKDEDVLAFRMEHCVWVWGVFPPYGSLLFLPWHKQTDRQGRCRWDRLSHACIANGCSFNARLLHSYIPIQLMHAGTQSDMRPCFRHWTLLCGRGHAVLLNGRVFVNLNREPGCRRIASLFISLKSRFVDEQNELDIGNGDVTVTDINPFRLDLNTGLMRMEMGFAFIMQ